MKIPKDILFNNEKVAHFKKISTQTMLKNQKDCVIIIQDFRVALRIFPFLQTKMKIIIILVYLVLSRVFSVEEYSLTRMTFFLN